MTRTLSTPTSRAAVALGAALALALALVPAAPAHAQPVEPRDTTDACGDAPEDGFVDTGDDGSGQEAAVDCIAWYEITQGRTATRYDPSATVKRWEMATFLARKLRQAEVQLEEPSEDFFDDDDDLPDEFEANVNFIAHHGVTQGFADGTYRPHQRVTRAQMASFIVRQMEILGADLPEPGQDYFDDDDDQAAHETNINTLAELGVATGVEEGRFAPSQFVTRGQMARFLARDLDFLVDEGLMVPPDERLLVTLDSTTVEQGADLTGEVSGGPSGIDSVVGNGCGLTDEDVEDTDAGQDGVQFTERIPGTQPPGECDITFTASFTGGEPDRSATRTVTVVEVTAPEADDGQHTNVQTVAVARGDDTVVGEGDDEGHDRESFGYDSNDTLQLGGEAISLDELEGLLTGADETTGTDGDVFDVDYVRDTAATSTFDVTTDNVPAPVNANAVVGDFDDDGEEDDVVVSWGASAQPDAVYDVFRDDAALGDGEINELDTEVASGVEGTSVTLLDEPEDTYDYFVRAVGGTSGAESAFAQSNEVTVPPPENEPGERPQSENAVLTHQDDADGTTDENDEWRYAFDQPLAAIQAGDRVRVEGDGGNVGEAIHGDNATLALNQSTVTVNGKAYPRDHVLTVRLDATQLADPTGGTVDLNYPVEVVVAPGLSGDDGDPIDWDASFDITVETETDRPTSSTLIADDADGNGVVSDGDTVEVTFATGQTMSGTPGEPVANAVTIRDGGGDTVTLEHGANATFAYDDPTLDPGTNRELTITVDSTGTTDVGYGGTTAVTGHVYVINEHGWGWDLGSGDTTVDVDDGTPPEMQSAEGDINGSAPDTITVTYDEVVDCDDSSAAAAQFVYDPNVPVLGENDTIDQTTASAIDCNGTTTVELTFPNGTFQSGDGNDRLFYADDGNDGPEDIRDLGGNRAEDDDIAVTG